MQNNEVITVLDEKGNEPSNKKLRSENLPVDSENCINENITIDSENSDDNENITIDSDSSIEINEISDPNIEKDNVTVPNTLVDKELSNEDIQIIDIQSSDNNETINEIAIEEIDHLVETDRSNATDNVDGSQKNTQSMEVTYDNSNAINNVIETEKTNRENYSLMSVTNDVESSLNRPDKNSQESTRRNKIQIISDEIINPSQQTIQKDLVDVETNENKKNEIPIVNGGDKKCDNENAISDTGFDNNKSTDANKNVTNGQDMAIEDMMADFVDEMNEEINVNI